MKKWLSGLVIILLLAVAGIYIFIPSALTISEPVMLRATERGTLRYLGDAAKWEKWWPGKKESNSRFSYEEHIYLLPAQSFNPIQLWIQHKQDTVNSSISILPIRTDSVALIWQTELSAGGNPIKKFTSYLHAKKLKSEMEVILSNFRLFIENPDKVYTIRIEVAKVKDTMLVSTKEVSTAYPSISSIYKLIARLKEYIQKEGATETNYPMLNIRPLGDDNFETMVAIPVNKLLKGNETIFTRRMVAGNILITEVKGGQHRIDKALAELEVYLNDHQRASPAIPFESLITDRSKESDTTKWVTRIYYPVL